MALPPSGWTSSSGLPLPLCVAELQLEDIGLLTGVRALRAPAHLSSQPPVYREGNGLCVGKNIPLTPELCSEPPHYVSDVRSKMRGLRFSELSTFINTPAL